MITNIKINANAIAKEFNFDEFPLRLEDGTFARDEKGHLIMTNGKKIVDPKNIVTNTDVFVNNGKYWMGDILIGANSGQITHIGVGGCTSTPIVTDTDLISNIGTRHLYTDRFRATNIDTISVFFASSENNGTWNETGLFTGASGILFCRSTFTSPVTKTSANTQTIDFDITIG